MGGLASLSDRIAPSNGVDADAPAAAQSDMPPIALACRHRLRVGSEIMEDWK
jgi:hypothetical protein